MFPLSDPAAIRAKLEALRKPNGSARGMRLSYSPLIYKNRQFFPIPMVHHGNISKVDDDGIVLDMNTSSNPHATPDPVDVPLIPPAMQAEPYFSALQVRVPFSAVVDVWEDLAGERPVNLWLRHAVVMTGQGWMLLPFLFPPELVARPR